ncbi:MAG: signal peptidase I [Gammaproteobacteria bacterium]
MRKFLPLLLALLFIALLVATIILVKRAGYAVTYQATSSMPRGLYLLAPVKSIARGDIVLFYPPITIRDFLKQQHWLPRSGLIMKYALGVPGDYVCRRQNELWINRKKVAHIYHKTSSDLSLPQQKFCGKLGKTQYFLISIFVPNSFDSRYFGAVERGYILGKAISINGKFY